MIRLIIKQIGTAFRCELEGNPGLWETGPSEEIAIGKWFISHGADHGVKMKLVNEKNQLIHAYQ